jgi:hypothetical protein
MEESIARTITWLKPGANEIETQKQNAPKLAASGAFRCWGAGLIKMNCPGTR